MSRRKGTGGDATEREVHFHASNERYIRKHHGSAGWWVFHAGVAVARAGTGRLVQTVGGGRPTSSICTGAGPAGPKPTSAGLPTGTGGHTEARE